MRVITFQSVHAYECVITFRVCMHMRVSSVASGQDCIHSGPAPAVVAPTKACLVGAQKFAPRHARQGACGVGACCAAVHVERCVRRSEEAGADAGGARVRSGRRQGGSAGPPPCLADCEGDLRAKTPASSSGVCVAEDQ